MAGACHGAAIGRGGFRLSLYGGDPEFDHQTIVRELEGRRVNLAKPAESLIILKPAEYLEHGGGAVFDPEGESVKLLQDWIAQGARLDQTRLLDRLEITSQQHLASKLNEPIPLRAVAHYRDKSRRDVTRWTIFAPEDASAVIVEDGDGDRPASARLQRRGRHLVIARYLGQVVPLELMLPFNDANDGQQTATIQSQLDAATRRNFIDDEVLAKLQALRLPPSPDVDDATFLRRVTLDLTGRLPTLETLEQWLNESPHANNSAERKPGKGKSGSRREAWVTRLMQSEAFNEFWTMELAQLFRVGANANRGGDKAAMLAYHQWLGSQVRADASYQELARALLLALGNSHSHGPANFYRTVAGPREQAELVAELFMASRLRCANCHNHPLDRWTQDDYHGLAAIFARVEPGLEVRIKETGNVIHPRTQEFAQRRIPGERFLPAAANDPRAEFTEWLVHADNPYFAKSIVNRLWQRLMGRGLVEPVNDFRDTNPATHPALLEKLADDFVAHGYSLRHTLKTIAASAAYARSAKATALNQHDDRFYSHARWRPLPPEVLADAISDVLDVPDRYGEQPEGARAVTLVSPYTPSRALDVLGRCSRAESCESGGPRVGGLAQTLHLLNGELLNRRLDSKHSRLARLQARQAPPAEIIGTFYQVALSREPTAQEQRHWKSQFDASSQHKEFWEDFLWGLLSCQEFVTNH